MRKLILATATLAMLSPAAHAEQGMCFAWVETDGKLICEVRGPAPRIYTPYRIGENDLGTPNYTSRSQTVVRSSYGTSVINSNYRSYRR